MSQTAIEALQQARQRMRNCWGAIQSDQVIDKDVEGSLKRGMDEIDAALSALTQGGVKGLEWEQLYEKQTIHPKEWHGTGIFDARYIIKQRLPDSDFFVVGKNHKTLEAAKAAAQQDYEQRIRSALSTKLQEPVGEALSYAENLARNLAAKHYPENTEWKPLDGDLIGILTQIDNMTAGMSRSTLAHQPVTADWKFKLGDIVYKPKGSWWEGRVVGFYSTEQTPEGYCVQIDTLNGPVQIYPASALAALKSEGRNDG